MGSTNGSPSTAISKSTVNSTPDLINNSTKHLIQNQQTIMTRYLNSIPSAGCSKPPTKSSSNKMSFMYMNTARLLKNHSQNKSKIQLIRDFCCESTQFIGLCETFLHDAILDSEIQMQDFSIYRTDCANWIGGGVCFYVKKSIACETLLSYSNY